MELPQPEFLFELSEPRVGVSKLAQATIHLAEIAERIANEDRTLVDHASGRPENVAEHSNMLSIVSAAIAEEFFPDFDQNLVARYASVHDLIEAYVGDTPTHNISVQAQLNKDQLEKLGLERLKQEFVHLPKFVAFVESYEEQEVPEARFVRVMDKCMPAMMHFANNGEVLRKYITKEALTENSVRRAADLMSQYPELEPLIELRLELSAAMRDEFLD